VADKRESAITVRCRLRWCVNHYETNPLDPADGVTHHYSRTLGDDLVPLYLTQWDQYSKSGQVKIHFGGQRITPAQARQLATALLDAARIAETAAP
jgi:hypothetical protein